MCNCATTVRRLYIWRTVFWDTTPCSPVKIYWCSGGIWSPSLQATLKIQASFSSETSINFYQTTRIYIPATQYSWQMTAYVGRVEEWTACGLIVLEGASRTKTYTYRQNKRNCGSRRRHSQQAASGISGPCLCCRYQLRDLFLWVPNTKKFPSTQACWIVGVVQYKIHNFYYCSEFLETCKVQQHGVRGKIIGLIRRTGDWPLTAYGNKSVYVCTIIIKREVRSCDSLSSLE
jgi:hypothetical protein